MFSTNNPFERLPWWIFLVFGLMLFPVSILGFQAATKTNNERASALMAGPPELADIAQFDPKFQLGFEREINVAVQLHPEHVYDLERFGGEGVLITLVGAADARRGEVVRGAVITSRPDLFRTFIDNRVLGVGLFSPLYHLNGRTIGSHEQAPAVAAALEAAGLSAADNFSYIAPFYAGRGAALAPAHGYPREALFSFLGLGLLFIYYGAYLRRLRMFSDAQREALFATHNLAMQTPAE